MKSEKPLVAGLVLAAGASTRMNDLKQLLPVKGRPMLSGVLDEVLTSDLDMVVLVLGHRAADIRKALGRQLRHPRLQVIENPNYRRGISSSIKAGLGEIREQCDHVMIVLADMPFLKAGHINSLLGAYLASGRPLGALSVAGRRSHPVIFSRDLFGELGAIQGDVGARGLFQKYADTVCLAPLNKDWVDRDIDTPEDYAALKWNG